MCLIGACNQHGINQEPPLPLVLLFQCLQLLGVGNVHHPIFISPLEIGGVDDPATHRFLMNIASKLGRIRKQKPVSLSLTENSAFSSCSGSPAVVYRRFLALSMRGGARRAELDLRTLRIEPHIRVFSIDLRSYRCFAPIRG